MNRSFLKERFVDTGKGKIVYYVNNFFPGRPTVVLLHGLSSNHTTWLNAMNMLYENGYNFLAWDMRGHGLSDKAVKKDLYGISTFSDDLEKVITAEKIKNPVVAGYSFGGSVAMDYAVKHPESLGGLILVSANHADPLEYNGIGFFTSIGVAATNALASLMRWQKRNEYYYYQHGKSVGYWDAVFDGLRTMPVSVNLWLLTQTVAFDYRNRLACVKAPVTVVYAPKDYFVTGKEITEMKKELPAAEFIASKTDSHFVGTNSQEEVVKIILDFLKKI